MNYHEQTIIERLALAVSPPVVYRSTRTRTEADDTTTWQEAFSIPDEEAAAIAHDAIATYVAGFDE
jgi:endo-1,4-beta-mannosidase